MTTLNSTDVEDTNLQKIFDKEIEDGHLDGRFLASFATRETNLAILANIYSIISKLNTDEYLFMKTIETALKETLDIVTRSDQESEETLILSFETLIEQIRLQVENIKYDFQSPPKKAPVMYRGATTDGDPHTFLLRHWGGWISNKLVTIEKLKTLDRQLWLALRNKSQRDSSCQKPKDIFPTAKEYMRKLEELA